MTSNVELIKKYQNENVILTSRFRDRHDDAIDRIVSPLQLDFRQLCSPTDNQEKDPHCAGYATAQLIESLCWKNTGIPIQLDAHQIYAKAKELDSMPTVTGTRLECTLSAALELCKSILDTASYSIEFIDNDKNVTANLKHVIHKNMFILGGFNITNNWHRVTRQFNKVKDGGKQIGSHAVLICGYNKDNIIIQNTWGKSWGAMGFAQIPNDVFKKQFVYGVYLDRH